MTSKRNSRNVSVELTTSPEDWSIIRECYVHSFRRYPLYKYMVPDESKRDEFVRAYLDANYEVTVGSGQGILLALQITEDENSGDGEEAKLASSKVIGGVLFVPPSEDGCGWAIGSDEPYWNAYEKHGLARISEEGLERVKRYEAWENEVVAQKASKIRIPLWNGLFCAVSPDYSSKGVGSTAYKGAIKIMVQHWLQQQKLNIFKKKEVKSEQIPAKKTAEVEEEHNENFLGRCLEKFASTKSFHRFTPLNHSALPQVALIPKAENNKKESADKPVATGRQTNQRVSAENDLPKFPPAPLVVAISHSDRAAHFHQANGFHSVARVPFYDKIEGVTHFYTHVLVLDPFKTGRTNELNSVLN